MRRNLLLFTALLLILLPEYAFAGITEFSTPLEKILSTISGPAGRLISVIGLAACGLTYMFAREEMSGMFKTLVTIFFWISLVAFANSIISAVFSTGFTTAGAVI